MRQRIRMTRIEGRQGARALVTAILVTALSVGLVTRLFGCTSTFGKGPATGSPEFVELKWPEPPLKTRIRFVGNLVSERELREGISLRDSVLQFLSGQELPRERIANPMGIAVSADAGRVYVSDLSQGRVFVFDLVNKEVRVWERDQTKLSGPIALAVDGDENIYVVDTYDKVVRVFDRFGKALRQISDPSIERPTGIAIDAARGRLYVSDTCHQHLPNHYVKLFDLEGRFLKNIGKGKGSADGYLMFPTYLALDAAGNLYVADTMNARVQVFDPEGNFLRGIGERGNRNGQFERPKGVALDTFGNVYVVDSGWSVVQIFSPQGDVLLFFGGRGRYPGLMSNPSAIALDKNNRIYVADVQNFRLNIYELVNTTAEDSLLSLEEAKQKNFLAASEEGKNGGAAVAEVAAPN